MNVIKQITFEEILPVWRDFLWKGRLSEIRPMSSMTFNKHYDRSIYERFNPTFFGCYNQNGVLLGVNSFHKTGNREGRSRGVYVFENSRGKGYSKLLLNAAITQAKKEDCSIIWSLPRISSLQAYLSVGYRVCSEEINEGVEFGPNVYVKLNLS